MIRFLKDRYLRWIAALCIPMLALTIIRPFGFDNAMYQTMALEMQRFGRVPYLGTWDQNFPGIVYIHYLAILLFGTSDLSLRIFDVIVQFLFAIFLYRFWSRWLRPKTAALVSVLYIAYYVSGGGLLLAERDVYSGMLIVVGLECLLRAREGRGGSTIWILLAGLLEGVNLLLRPTALASTGILAVGFLLTSEGKFTYDKWPQVLLFTIVSIVPFGLVLAYYAEITGGLREFYLATIRWNLDLYASQDSGLIRLGLQFLRRAFLVPFAIYAVMQGGNMSEFFTRSVTRREGIVYASLTLVLLLSAIAMRKYFDYHFAPFFILLMPLPALGIERFVSRFRTSLARDYALILSLYAATFLAYAPRAPFACGLAITMKRKPMELSYAAQYPDPYWGARPERAAERYLNSLLNRTGRVEICSFTTNLQLHLGREPAGRYIQSLAIAYRTDPEDAGPPRYTSYQLRWQREYVDSLQTLRPRFIVLARRTHIFSFDDVYDDFLKYLPRFDSLLAASYRYDTAFGGYQIFRIRTDTAGHFAAIAPSLSDPPKPFGGIDP